MSTTTAVSTATFPRVNLLPPEIAEETRFRSIRALLALSVVGALAVVGGLYLFASNEATAAQESLDAAQATNTSLKAEEAKYAEVPRVYAAVAIAENQLTVAMGQEIRYSYVLNDLALTIPDDVWLTSLTVEQDVDGTAPVEGAWGTPAIGTITHQGMAVSYDDVAAWLDVLGKNTDFTDPYLTSATETDPIGDTDVLEFESSAALTSDALSNRYTAKAAQS
ncbi:MAG: PilN domain-containing protein [Actinomycetia bacterium]|jgi:Tfp pilus assembly protein PilN|nr:PilN domain-containing protein [Actinomycetes bacterium]